MCSLCQSTVIFAFYFIFCSLIFFFDLFSRLCLILFKQMHIAFMCFLYHAIYFLSISLSLCHFSPKLLFSTFLPPDISEICALLPFLRKHCLFLLLALGDSKFLLSSRLCRFFISTAPFRVLCLRPRVLFLGIKLSSCINLGTLLKYILYNKIVFF